MSPFTRHNNNDGTMSIYKDGKFIAAIDNCTATCDVFYSMETHILELQSKLNKAVKALKFYEDGSSYVPYESQSHVVWEAKEEFTGQVASKALQDIEEEG
jgi:hypothetical protein